ncbi:hypothetical protein FRB94_001789 [Tulasnella sp. JGI-2019a]|nr:hypothetical protein FRB94_001789 [Tulasnella sp. JGI-2019a]
MRLTTQEKTAIAAQNASQSAPPKRAAAPKKKIVYQEKLDVTVQCALYGAEMLSASPSLASAMSLAVIGNIIHVWWYDRQGAIQTKGLDFVEDLPYLLVLLLALQRLDPVGYGELPFKENKKITIPSGPIEITLGKAIVKHYGIVGRATNVYHATSSSSDPRQTLDGEDAHPSIGQLSTSIDSMRNLTLNAKDHQRDTTNSLHKLKMVAKISWVQEHRTAEHKIVEDAIKKAEKLPDGNDDRIAIVGHVPDIIATIECEGYDTKLIREQLGLGEDHTAAERNRRCRIIISRHLRPITELEGDDLLTAFLECVLCHRALWKLGFHHRDISEHNLMYFEEGGKVFGVLNDFDLATMAGVKHATNSERTGTLPFMALDLLTIDGCNGGIEHLYRHDLESFWWVFVWITFRFQNGKLVEGPPFSEWTEGSIACYNAKSVFMHRTKNAVKSLLLQRPVQWWDAFNLPLSDNLAFLEALCRRDDPSVPKADDVMQVYDKLIPKAYVDWKSKKFVPFHPYPHPPVSLSAWG